MIYWPLLVKSFLLLWVSVGIEIGRFLVYDEEVSTRNKIRANNFDCETAMALLKEQRRKSSPAIPTCMIIGPLLMIAYIGSEIKDGKSFSEVFGYFNRKHRRWLVDVRQRFDI